jgi:hypothetical protein
MLEFAAEILFRVACAGVGHGVLWAVTLGRWRPTDGRDDAASIVGLVFWVAVGIGVWLAFFR